MTVHTLRSAASARLRRITAATNQDEPLDLPLRAELFLISHHDRTGQRHIGQRALQRGLAGAVLLDLWLGDKVQIGWRPDARHGTWQLDPGRITVLNPDPAGDPIADAAQIALWQRDIPNTVRDFVPSFATADLYERTRADLVATGVLRHATHKRFRLFRRDGYRPVDESHPYQLRGVIRRAAAGYQPDSPDHRTLARAGLIVALGLAKYLFPPDMPTSQLQQRFHQITASGSDTTIRDIVNAISSRSWRFDVRT